MNKTRRTLIISSVIMAMAFIVAVVSVSAAWFGDMKSASRAGFVIQSDTLQDSASIDINSSKGMSGESIYPAIAELGYLLNEGAVAPTGAVLKSDTLPAGVAEKARVATVYFPIQFVGTPDTGYELENRKSLHIAMNSANIGKMSVTVDGATVSYDRVRKLASDEKTDNYFGDWAALGQPSLNFDGKGSGSINGAAFSYTVNRDGVLEFSAGGKSYSAMLIDYKDEFNVDVCLVEAQLNDDGAFESEIGVIATDKDYSALTGDRVFYDCYGYDTYLLVQPGIKYFVKAEIYFNKVDEECNFDLLDTVVRFNFKLNILSDGDYIRNHGYRTGGAAND